MRNSHEINHPAVCIIMYQTTQPVPSPQLIQPDFAVVPYVQQAPSQIYSIIIKIEKITSQI